jgi:hypothetical protein
MATWSLRDEIDGMSKKIPPLFTDGTSAKEKNNEQKTLILLHVDKIWSIVERVAHT